MKEVNAVIGGVVGFIGAVVGIALWRAWVLTQLWGWLVIPLFHLPPLRLVGAYTISLIVGFLTTSLTPTPAEKETSTSATVIRNFILALILPAISLFMGWIAHFFV